VSGKKIAAAPGRYRNDRTFRRASSQSTGRTFRQRASPRRGNGTLLSEKRRVRMGSEADIQIAMKKVG
jgi:hypothetical protein